MPKKVKQFHIPEGNLRETLLRSRLTKKLVEQKKATETNYKGIVEATKSGNLEELARLLKEQEDFDINAKLSENGDTLLHLAAKFNQTEVLEFLISCPGVNIDATANDGTTPLFYASTAGSIYNVKILLDNRASPHIASTKKDTPLHIAAANGYSNIAELLIAHGSEIEAKTIVGDTPLHLAARFGRIFTLELLLSYKANPKATNNEGETILVGVLQEAKKCMDDLVRKYTGLIEHMSQNGAVKLEVKLPNSKVSTVDRELEAFFNNPRKLLEFVEKPDQEYTDLSNYAAPLRAFATNLIKGLRKHSPHLTEEKIDSICTLEMIKYIGFCETIKVHQAQEMEIASLFRMIKFLVENGADLTTPDLGGNYPITLAADIGFSEIVEMLHERDVSLDSRDGQNKTPLIRALERDHHIFKVLSNYTVTQRFHVDTEHTIDCLIENCDDLALLDKKGNSALYYAALSGNKLAVEKMLEFEFDVNTRNSDGMTPLHGSLREGNKEVVKLLLDAGANPSKADEAGISPIHVAATFGLTESVSFLLDAGADINQAVPVRGTTALMIALLTRHENTALFLIQRGANKFARDQVASTIHIASKEGFTEIVELMLDEKPDEINCLTADGNSPLNIAASYKHVGLIKLLLSRGADSTIKNFKGKTPMASFLENKAIDPSIKKTVVKLFLSVAKPKASYEDDTGSSADSAASTIPDAHEEELGVTGDSVEMPVDSLA